MIQLWKLIIDFGYSDDWSIILTVADLVFLYFAYLICSILSELKKIRKWLIK